ncbi:hypothetical protein [Mesorhizobium sp. B2-6-2]|uniref:hypothetical protein n=1 Tax=Mesorhizobium sp. B2-6-2 TaxID=2589915 RepID=UPI00112E62B5|nr:hypothetical protein [Mesorhizobium sp. B2-6-2]TPJ77211.1 hypothetical protein FJ419_17015 [Mesorhizobium sp. B2-6-2]
MFRLIGAAILLVSGIVVASVASADPIDLVINPSPQEFSNTCQSYSMALAMAFAPNSPFRAETATELRELERRTRKALEASANGAEPTRDDWKAAVEEVSNGVLSVDWKAFDHLDPAMHFVADKTGVSNPDGLGEALSAALVQTPVMLSFTRIEESKYATTHIVTVFGVQLPDASMDDSVKPKLLLVNSAVKYPGGAKNVCAEEDLSDADKYRAIGTITDNYDMTLFKGKPYLVTFIVSNQK